LPLFSVIIPAYNRATLIERTLRSVIDQPADQIEIIVVDDGSSDGTSDAAKRLGQQVTVLQQANRGPGAARNLGLRAATGEYVAFLDSDDLWFPWTAQRYQDAIQCMDRPAFIAGKPFIFTNDSEAAPGEAAPLACNTFDDYFASGDEWRWYSASSFVMRRDLLVAAGGFTEDRVNAEDADAAMRMGTVGRFVQITSPYTFAYRRHQGSIMSNIDLSLAGVRRLVEQEVKGNFPGGPQRALERRRIISSFTRPMCIDLLKRGKSRSAWDLYGRTFRWNLKLGRWKFIVGFPAHALRRQH
jgi:glycosyltransferase involved in cell wall biosynthesis